LAIWETEDFNNGCRTYAEVVGVINDPDGASNVPCPTLVHLNRIGIHCRRIARLRGE